MKPTTQTYNPFTSRFGLCHCGRTFSLNTGEYVKELPDDSPGVLEDGQCCWECQKPPLTKDGTKPTAWIIGGLIAALAFHVLILVLLNR